jgi:hypothetical protein
MEIIILKNIKIKTIKENMSNTLEEMKYSLREIIEEQERILSILEGEGFPPNPNLASRRTSKKFLCHQDGPRRQGPVHTNFWPIHSNVWIVKTH